MTYAVDTQIGGKLAPIGNRLFAGVAGRIADAFFAQFAQRIAPAGDAAVTSDGAALRVRAVRRRRIAVVGAGMGGITAAVLLQRAGHDCRVYEQAPVLAKIGAGINVGPNATRIFRRMGLDEAMRTAGIEPRLKYSRDWQSGEVMFTVPVPELRERYGDRFLAFHRGALQDTLASALAPDSIQFGKRLLGLEAVDHEVQLRFEDGTAADAELVIGADGVHSRVRELLFGAAPADYYGKVAYRALIPTSALGGLTPADNTKWWAPDRYVLIYYTTEARDEVNLVTGSPQAWTSATYAPCPASIDELLTEYAGFHPEVQGVLQAARSITKWPMLERKPFTPWSRGPVVLLGDASHPTTPHMGQGAGMAFEDAVVLSRCIDACATPSAADAFATYERLRFERTARIQRESHANEWTKTGMDGDWLYGYDAFTVPFD